MSWCGDGGALDRGDTMSGVSIDGLRWGGGGCLDVGQGNLDFSYKLMKLRGKDLNILKKKISKYFGFDVS